MNRRQLLTMAAACLSLRAQGRGRGHGKDKDSDNDHDHGREREARFRREDYAAIERHYAGPRNLPPGLRKKYARTGKLPPGWEKKMRPFPPALMRALPPPPPNVAYGYIDGVAVVYDRTTRIILDSVDLIAAIAGR